MPLVVNRGGHFRPPRIVVYGPPKLGKSSFGAESEAPVFVTTEDGVDNIPVDQTPVAKTWDEFVANIKSVAVDKHSFKTLVVDTLNGAAQLAAQHVCDKLFKGDWGPRGFASFGQGWSATSEEMRVILDPLDACRQRGMWVLMLAHTGIQSVKNPVEGDFSKYAPDLDRKIWSRFYGWADIILRGDFEYTVLESQKRAAGTSTRVLRASGSAAEDAGCRVGYELPATLPLSWPAFVEALGQVSPVISGIKERWPGLSADERTAALKWLGIASVDALSKAPSQKLSSLLNRMKATHQPPALPAQTPQEAAHVA